MSRDTEKKYLTKDMYTFKKILVIGKISDVCELDLSIQYCVNLPRILM